MTSAKGPKVPVGLRGRRRWPIGSRHCPLEVLAKTLSGSSAETAGTGCPLAPSPADLITKNWRTLVRAGEKIRSDEDGRRSEIGAAVLAGCLQARNVWSE